MGEKIMKIVVSNTKKGFIQRAIRFFTKGKRTHSFPLLGEIDGVQLGLSADELIVDIVDVNDYRNDNANFIMYEVPDLLPKCFWLPKLLQYNKKRYPYLELLWFVYRWFRRLFNPSWKGVNFFNTGGVFCSELTMIALELSGHVLEGDPNSLGPDDVETIIKSIDGVKVVGVWNE